MDESGLDPIYGIEETEGSERLLLKETSLANRQCLAFARGDVSVHAVANKPHIFAVIADKRYCLHCGDVRNHDQVVVAHGKYKFIALTWCRRCGEAVEG